MAYGSVPLPTAPDVSVYNDGSVVSFKLLSPAARTWVDENVETEGWQWLGWYTLVVDHRSAQGLAQGMINDGLEVR